uniref:ShKT domain-containing protein n=1 Tax=Rhodosorus marinus TaxID=101924 RepID=A0A7S3EPA3_9RHOD|mmetsp:Transcript_9939/g.42005  ORF Transcript_9939/g.42005 Transcript_9939/m.42005 type:complete len:149 (+) Transcript_9939:63-509(+)
MKVFAFVLLGLVGLATCDIGIPPMDPECEDYSSLCDKYPKSYCEQPWFAKKCQLYCGLCGPQIPPSPPPRPCEDSSTYCASLPKKQCFDPDVRAKCQKTCNACPCKDSNPDLCAKLPLAKCSEPLLKALCPERCGDCCPSVYGYSVYC